MNKLRILLILLLALALLTAFAALPQVVAAVQDTYTIGMSHTSQVVPVRLEIREDTSAMAGLALMGKLSGIIEVPDQVASMTRIEATEAAIALLQPYVDAGLIQPFEVFYADVRCYLGQAAENTELNAIFWTVTVICDEEGLLVIDTAIDDESGRLLRVHVTDNFAPYADAPEEILMPFAELYFDGLGIEDYGAFVTDDLAERYIGENAYGIRYRFGDALYGEINVDLYAYPYGFYMEFPNAGGDYDETDKRATTPADFGSVDHAWGFSARLDCGGG